MTRDEFANAVSPLIRHGLTVAAGVLAAHGYASANDAMTAYGPSLVLLLCTLAWSVIEKNGLVAKAVAGVSSDDVGLLASALRTFRQQGASPLLVAHTAQVLASIAVTEANQFAANAFAAGQVPPPPPVPAAEADPVPVPVAVAPEAAPQPNPAPLVPVDASVEGDQS